MSEKFKGIIRSFQLTGKGGIKYNYVRHRRIDDDIDNVVVTENDPRPPHLKLKNRMRGLLAHAILIARLNQSGKRIDEAYIKERTIVNDPDYKDYEVYGLSLKGVEDGELVTLLLRKRMINDKWCKIELPPIEMFNDDTYMFSGNLEIEVSEVIDELVNYINSGNDDELQQELFESESLDF